MKIPRDRIAPLLIMLAILMALALPLMFLLENFVQDAIVLPLSYMAWLLGIIAGALPQSWLLAAGLALMTLFAVRSLRGKSVAERRRQLKRRDSQGSVSRWAQRVALVSRGSYSKERLDQHFGQLLLRVLAHEERMPTREAVRRLNEGDLEVPAELQVYLKQALRSGVSGRRSSWAWLVSLFGFRRERKPTLDGVSAEIDPALRYIETQLKIEQVEEHNE